ncbi:MAG: hypothetical protein ACOX22_11090 [Caldicoprobacterales bacterium]
MHFASYSFILYILVLVPLYYLIPKKLQWMLLLVASYVFYSFAGAGYLTYILVTTISTWFAAIKIDKLKQVQEGLSESNEEGIVQSRAQGIPGGHQGKAANMDAPVFDFKLWYPGIP